MCGICGVVQVGGEPREVVAQDVLDRMTDAMTHRGPNDRGTFRSPGIALGVRRLSIVDVAGGHQPFANEDKSVWAVQNGELYNHAEIRDGLSRQGHRFREPLRHRDSAAPLRRGRSPVRRAPARQVRHRRLGRPPPPRRDRPRPAGREADVLRATSDDLVVFASELKSLLASGLVGGELDFEAIEAYMTLGFVPGPMTPLAAVRKVMPGERVIVDPDGVQLERYWEYPKPEPDTTSGPAELAEGLLEQLDEAVRTRLMSDVPLGAMLSGGLDSSLIVASDGPAHERAREDLLDRVHGGPGAQ